MNLITYGLIKETYKIEGDEMISYGIAVLENIKAENVVLILDSVRNISTNRAKVENLIKRCNELKLSVIHLQDVIDDMLNQ